MHAEFMGGGGEEVRGVTQTPRPLVPILGLAKDSSDRNPVGTNLVEK